MTREDLKHIIHFAEINGMMDWTFEDALNEYLTTKETAEDIETAIDNYEFYLSTGGQFHSHEEFIARLEETDEYLTTKGVADSYENFSYFDKPITEVNDLDLISWYIMFLNGADYSDPQFRMEYDMFHEECKNRGKEFNLSIDYLDSIL